MFEFSDEKRALSHLAYSITHIRSLSDLIDNCKSSTLHSACIESYLVNYRLIFEFLDNCKNKKDFAAQSFLGDWNYDFNQEAKDVRDLASQHVVNFSRERLNPEVVKRVLSTDLQTLKRLNDLLEEPLQLFKKKTPCEFTCPWRISRP